MSSFEPTSASWIGARSFVPSTSAESGFAPQGGESEASGAPSPNPREAAEAIAAAAREEGRQAGVAEATTRLEPALRALDEAVRKLDEQRSGYLQSQRQLLVELALEIAGTVLRREVPGDVESLALRIGTALEALPGGDDPVTVEMSHADYTALTAALREGRALRGIPRDEHVVLAGAGDLASGDVRVSSGATAVDARLSTLLQNVREAIRDVES